MLRTIVTALCVVVLLAGLGRADPSFRGYSGLLKIPTADTLGRGQYNLGLNTTEAEDLDDPSYLANFGVGRDLEAGVLWLHPEHSDNETVINLKYRFEPGSDSRPSFAVGITDVMDEVDTGIYAVGTWEFGDLIARVNDQEVKRIRLHAGLGGGAIDDFFFGAEARFGRHFIVMADHMNDEFSVGARAHLWRNFTAQAGLLDMDDLAFGITYTYPTSEAGTLVPVITEEKPGAATAKAPPEAMIPRVKAGPEAEPEKHAEEAAEVSAGPPPPPEPETPAKAPTPAPQKSEAEPETEEPKSPAPVEATPEPPSKDEPAVTPAEQEEPGRVTEEPPAEEAMERPAPPGPEQDEPAAKELTVDHSKSTVPIPLDGLPVEVEGGHAFVPARQVADWLGFRVDAQHDRRGIKVTIHAGLRAAAFYIGDDRVDANGERISLDAPTYYFKQRIAMVPVELFKLLGVPLEVDADASRALLERHDVVGVVSWGK